MKAMVLCAGFGTRLGDLTRDLPKPLLPLQGQPLLAYLLGHLKAQGFREVAINLHFLPHLIREHFGDGSRWGMSFSYSDEDTLLGTAGGVKKMAAFFRDEPAFLVQYGDVLTDQDFTRLAQFHSKKKAMATLLVHQRAKSNSVVSLDPAGRVIGFLERPTDEARRGVVSPWVNSGICICSPEILGHIPPGKPCDLPRDVFAPLAGTGRLFGFPLSGFRGAIDSAERLDEARRAVAGGGCHVQPLVPPGGNRSNSSL